MAQRLLYTLDQGLDEFIAGIPPTMVSACVAVIDDNNEFLLLRRS
jgi:hypothetical protein